MSICVFCGDRAGITVSDGLGFSYSICGKCPESLGHKSKRKRKRGSCPKCGSENVGLVPPVIEDVTYGRMCLDCRHCWQSDEGIPLVHVDAASEKPKRKNSEIKCPCCGFTDVLVNPVGLDEGTFMCQTCVTIWDIYGNQTEPTLAGSFLALHKSVRKLGRVILESIGIKR